MRHAIKTELGFGLIETMVTISILMFAMLGISSILAQSLRMTKKADSKTNLFSLREEIKASLYNNPTFRSTVEANLAPSPLPAEVDLAGVIDYTLDPPIPQAFRPLPVVLRNLGGAGAYTTNWLTNDVLIDNNPNNTDEGDQNTRGYTIDGRKCIGFDPVIGNDDCPIRITAEWQAVCSSPYPCKAFGVNSRILFQYVPGPGLIKEVGPINIASLNVPSMMVMGENFLANQCLQNLGQWDGTQCLYNGMSPCAANERMMGVQRVELPSPHLEPVCVSIFSGADVTSCPAGEKLVQLNENGTRVCRPNLEGGTRPICNAGERLSPLDDKGTYTCIPILATQCPAGKKLVGINPTTGQPICQDNLEGRVDASDCPAGQKMIGIDVDGTRRCEATLSSTNLDLNCGPGQQATSLSNGTKVCTNVTAIKECYQQDTDITVSWHPGDTLLPPAVPLFTCGYHMYNEAASASCDRANGYRIESAHWTTVGQCNTFDNTYMPQISIDYARESVSVPGGAPAALGGGAGTACERTEARLCAFPGDGSQPAPYTRTFQINCCRNR